VNPREERDSRGGRKGKRKSGIGFAFCLNEREKRRLKKELDVNFAPPSLLNVAIKEKWGFQ